MPLWASLCLGWFLLASEGLAAEDAAWSFGSARAKITPEESLWMGGFAARTRPAEGTLDDLWVKVLVLRAPENGLAVLVAVDLVGIPKWLYEAIVTRLHRQHGLERSQILLASSHTHSGPVLREALQDIYPLDEPQRARIARYSDRLLETIITTVGEALAQRRPGRLWAGEGRATFAVNRRTNNESNLPALLKRGEAPRGPSDFAVPVLAVRSPEGQLPVVVFGYAAHTSALTENYRWSADYAGYAQRALEERHPEALALFFQGCGSDQSAAPRGSIERCRAMGQELAQAVEAVLDQPMRSVAPRLRTALEFVPLEFGVQPTRADLETTAAGTDYKARWAQRLLREMESGRTFPVGYPEYPVQAWKLGEEQLWISLGGEVCVDYALRFKRELGPNVWVTGYANDVMAYIPSRRLWEEGGYQAGAFEVYGLPATRWASDIEDRLAAAVARQVSALATPWDSPTHVLADRRDAAAMLVDYYETMSRPRLLEMRTGEALKARQRLVRENLLTGASLWPLPERIPLDLRFSPPLDHEWCTIRRVAYQLWPGVYSTGLLYLPKQYADRPAPAVLCPHGHWQDGNAHPIVQTRCLVLAKMGYVVFSSTQQHFEDPALGISHQTVMIWNNIRALDLLQSLPDVDGTRLGATGCSGGGTQTQMLVAVDPRLRAATIAGLTCDYREILSPGNAHCGCNHFPNIMRDTDQPEISALGLPIAVQYLTMNDWTRTFEKANYPTIRFLYELNGLAGHTDCYYEPTEHTYDRSKRRRMYAWMERWLRGREVGTSIEEPAVQTLPVEALLNLKADLAGDQGFQHLSQLYAVDFSSLPPITNRPEWEARHPGQLATLRELLGEPMPRQATAKTVASENHNGITIERILCPSEGKVLVPTVLLHPTGAQGKLPVVILCDERGKDVLLAESGDSSAKTRARQGALVVLPDVRFVGELSLKAMAGFTDALSTFHPCSALGEAAPNRFEDAWTRNAMLWGRPLPAMAATDLSAVLDYLAARSDADLHSVTLVARGQPATAALFMAVLDERVAMLDLDLAGKCFATRSVPLVPSVLRHGDVLQWSALLATRRLTLRGLPKEAGDPAWLAEVFRAVGNPEGLRLHTTF